MLRIQYENDKLFDLVNKSKVFQIMNDNNVDHLKITEQTIIRNKYLNELKKIVYEQLKQMNCNALEPNEENFVMEFWNTEFKKYNPNALFWTNKTQKTSLDWHTDDFELIPYKTYTAILYYHRGEGISGGNLKILEYEGDYNNEEIKIIDTWSNKTFLIFETLLHCPEKITVIDNNKELKRQILTMFFAKN
jgi:hypothetical protein